MCRVVARTRPKYLPRWQEAWRKASRATLTLLFSAFGFVAISPYDSSAEDRPPTIEGLLSVGSELVLDDQVLAQFESHTITTSTIWTEGTHVFSGPSLLDIVRKAGVTDGTVRLTALNDYSVTIPIAELTETAPIVAGSIDGKPFAVRDKGPFWVIYPYDSAPEYQTEVTYARSIWQLSTIAILQD